MDKRQDKGGEASNQGPKVTSETFTARTLLVREGFPRIGWRAGKPVIIDETDGVIRILKIQAQRDPVREQIRGVVHSLEEARALMLARGDLVAARAYIEDALAIATRLSSELAP